MPCCHLGKSGDGCGDCREAALTKLEPNSWMQAAGLGWPRWPRGTTPPILPHFWRRWVWWAWLPWPGTCDLQSLPLGTSMKAKTLFVRQSRVAACGSGPLESDPWEVGTSGTQGCTGMARELVGSRLPWPTYNSLSLVSPSLSVGAICSSHPSLPLRVPFHQNTVFTCAFWGFLPLVTPFPEQMSRCGIDGAEQESSWAPPTSTLGSAASSLPSP